MNHIYAVALLLVVITSTSSTLCVSSSNYDDDQMSMHDAGIEMMTQASPVQTGTYLLEDGKELKLSRKSSPGRNQYYCVGLYQPCGLNDPCCDPNYCTGYAFGTCIDYYCIRTGDSCGSSPCCGVCVLGYCVG